MLLEIRRCIKSVFFFESLTFWAERGGGGGGGGYIAILYDHVDVARTLEHTESQQYLNANKVGVPTM